MLKYQTYLLVSLDYLAWYMSQCNLTKTYPSHPHVIHYDTPDRVALNLLAFQLSSEMIDQISQLIEF